MKPSDRSLDIAVIGLGQAGGNLAAEFSRRGYRAMALNTAQTDLTALGAAAGAGLTEAQRLYIGLDGYDGAGADLNYGRECVAENADRIREEVARHTEGADIVMVTAGLGGGTGSAVSELVKVLDSLELPLITLTTLPGDQESGIAKVNAVRAVSDLVKLPDLGLIFADNARLAQLHGNVTLDEYFDRINEIIVAPLDAFNQLNARDGLQPIRTLDGEDLRTLLMSTGVINYAEGTVDELSVDTVVNWIGGALTNSSVMPSGFNMEDLAYVGLIIEASGSVLAHTPFTFFNEVGERLKSGTSGAGIYMGVYRDEHMAAGAPPTLRLLASTPSLPAGVSAIVSDAQREGGALRDKLSRSVSSLDLGDIADFDLLPARPPSLTPTDNKRRRSRTSRRPAPKPIAAAEASTKDGPPLSTPATIPPGAVIAQPPGPPPGATAPTPAPSTQPSSAKHSSAAPPGPPPKQHSVNGSSGTPSASAASASNPSAIEPPAGPSSPPKISNTIPPESLDPAAETGDKSEPETYDRLVDAFINTESPSIRKRIATRLHTSRNSDHPLARFYANRAIERLVDAGEEESLESVMSSLGV